MSKKSYKRYCDYCKNYYDGVGVRFCSLQCANDWRKEQFAISSMKRFWDKVDTAHPSGCWIWTAHKDKGGYGRLRIKGKDRRAHRFIWEVTFGSIPKGKFVCHHCDTPSCVRLDHLFIGTNQDNMDDKVAKKRQFIPKGILHSQNKLTEENVFTIRALGQQGVRQKNIAAKFGISQSQVSLILLRKEWKHI